MLASSSWQPSCAGQCPNATQRSGVDASNLPHANVKKMRRADRTGRQCTITCAGGPPQSAHAFGNLPRAATCSGRDSRQPSVGKAAPAYAAPVHAGNRVKAQRQRTSPCSDPGVLTKRTYIGRTTHRPPPSPDQATPRSCNRDCRPREGHVVPRNYKPKSGELSPAKLLSTAHQHDSRARFFPH